MLAALLVAAPAPALGAGTPAGSTPVDSAGAGQANGRGSFWFPVGNLSGLPGVEEARAARLWVSGEPLLASGALELSQDGGSGEGGTGGRAMELKLSGTHCDIYVDSNARPYPSDNTLQGLVSEFDGRIWPNNTATFGNIIWSSIDINIVNIDGTWGVGGYFTPADPNAVYIDCADINYWGYQILAHEFQHLQHNQKDPDEELWLNEGCADLAIAVIYGQNDGTITGHVDGFESNPDNDLTVFQNQMYDYGSAYAFVQYLWDHFGGQSTIRSLVANKGNGAQGIDDTLSTAGHSETFSGIFPDWCVANRIDDNSLDRGQYGYPVLNIRVGLAGDYSSLPVCATGDVHRWAADCYRFRGGNTLDLLVGLSAQKTGFSPRLFGLDPSGANTTVLEIRLDGNQSGEGLLRAFGRDFTEALLFTPTSTAAGYDFSARLVDRTPPMTTATVFPPEPDGSGGWYVRAPTITLRSSEDGSRILYRWDGSAEEEYSAPLTAPEGEHSFGFYSVDQSGNRDADRSLSFRVDTIAPEARLELSPALPDGDQGWYLSPPTVALSTEENATLFFAWDGGIMAEYEGPVTAPEGRHRLEFYAVDAAGNEGATISVDLLIDTRAPAALASLSPAVPDGAPGWYRTRPTITIGTDEPGARVFYRWEDTDVLAYLRPLEAPEGTHRLHYWAQDPAGNNGTVQDLLLRVDTLPPADRLSVEPRAPDGKGGWWRARPTLTITVEDADPAASAFYAWDGAEPGPYFGPFKAPEGVHTLVWYSTDTRGNAGNESRRTIMVDTLPPETEILVSPADPGGWWYRVEPGITLVTDVNAQAWYSWDDGPLQAYTGPFTAGEGEHVLQFHSRDAAGNSERLRRQEFLVDTAPPVAALALSSRELLVGDLLHLDASGSSDLNGLEAYSIEFGDGGRRTGTESSWQHVYESPGAFVVVLKVRDVSGSWSEPVSANLTVAMPPRPPPPADQGRPALTPTQALLALVAVAAVAALAAVALRRRRRKDGTEE